MPKTLSLLFKGGNLEKTRFFLIFAEKCANWVLILKINVIYGSTGVWVQNAMQFGLLILVWNALKGKRCKNNHEALQKIPVVYPYPLEFDNLRYTQMRPIPDWLPKSMGGGDKWCKCCYMQDIHGIFFHLKFILFLQITSSLIITGSLKG